MGTNNSFKQLAEEEERKYPHPPPETERDVMGNVRVFHLMSNVVELYLPRIFDMFIALFGGTDRSSEASNDQRAKDARNDSNNL